MVVLLVLSLEFVSTHHTRLVNAPHPDFTNINQLKIQVGFIQTVGQINQMIYVAGACRENRKGL